MATVKISNRCLKCSEVIRTIDCTECKKPFCIKHIFEHQQDLSTHLDYYMAKHDRILQQLCDKEKENESLKKDIRSQIDQWEKYMIERVHCKVEQVRERLDQLTNNDEKVIIENAQELTKKINKTGKDKDLLEQYIEQLKQNIINVQQTFDKLIQQGNLELYIEPNHMIDWNHLIYVRKQSATGLSSLIKKEMIEKDSKDAKTTINSSSQRITTSKFTSEFPSLLISFDDEWNSTKKRSRSNHDSLMDESSNEDISNSKTIEPLLPPVKEHSAYPLASTINIVQPSNSVQRKKRPLVIIDAISHRPVTLTTPDSSVNSGQTSSQASSMNDATNLPSANSLSATDTAKQPTQLELLLRELLNNKSKK